MSAKPFSLFKNSIGALCEASFASSTSPTSSTSLFSAVSPLPTICRHRLSPRHAPLFHFPPHPPLLALVLPSVPPRLRALQNPQLLHAPEGPLRPAGPCMRPAERKTCGQK